MKWVTTSWSAGTMKTLQRKQTKQDLTKKMKTDEQVLSRCLRYTRKKTISRIFGNTETSILVDNSVKQ